MLQVANQWCFWWVITDILGQANHTQLCQEQPNTYTNCPPVFTCKKNVTWTCLSCRNIYTSTANAYGWYSDTTRSPGRYFHIKFVGWKIGNSGCVNFSYPTRWGSWVQVDMLLDSLAQLPSSVAICFRGHDKPIYMGVVPSTFQVVYTNLNFRTPPSWNAAIYYMVCLR